MVSQSVSTFHTWSTVSPPTNYPSLLASAYIIIDDYGDALENSERSSEKLFYPALFVQQIKDAQFRFDKIDTGLIVIEVYESPFDLLPKIFLLL